MRNALNFHLKKETIVITKVELVDNDFHARFMVKKKEYIYKINVGEYNPIYRNYIYQYNKQLNILKMKKQSKFLIGTHDFSSFANKEDPRDSYIRTIYKISISKSKDTILIKFIGDGFLKYQVRNMVGALIESSESNINIKKILEEKNRKSFGKIAPPEGLYLNDVKY